MALMLAMGCGKTDVLPETTAAPQTTEQVTEEAATEPATEETTQPETEEETEEETTGWARPSGNRNLLTGLYDLPDDEVGTRPVAVAVNNVMAAMPQYGIAQADIIYETVVEGDETRLLAIYPSYKNLPDICSIRSYRYYFPTLALQYDAIYIHWGEDESKLDYYYSLDMDSYDGIRGGQLFGRDAYRLSLNYNVEHTSVFFGSLLPDQMAQDGVRTELATGFNGIKAFNFNDFEETVSIGGDECKKIRGDFGKQWAKFEYDEESQTYLKWNDDDEHIDGATGEQLSFTNLILLETDISDREDGYHKDVNWQGGEGYKGYYITAGEVIEITWAKPDEESKLILKDTDGRFINVNCGKT